MVSNLVNKADMAPVDYAQRRWDMMIDVLRGAWHVDGARGVEGIPSPVTYVENIMLKNVGHVAGSIRYDAKPVDFSEKV